MGSKLRYPQRLRGNFETATHYRQHRSRTPDKQARGASDLMARRDVREGAAHPSDGCARQQHGAHRLGVAGKGKAGGLRSSGRGHA